MHEWTEYGKNEYNRRNYGYLQCCRKAAISIRAAHRKPPVQEPLGLFELAGPILRSRIDLGV